MPQTMGDPLRHKSCPSQESTPPHDVLTKPRVKASRPIFPDANRRSRRCQTPIEFGVFRH